MAYAALLFAAACAGRADPLPSSGDARLDALRHWAVPAPCDDFVRVWNRWWGEFYFEYPHDEVLWRGVDRLARWALAQPERSGQDLLTALHAAAVQDPRPASWLQEQRETLRALRTRARNRRASAPAPSTTG